MLDFFSPISEILQITNADVLVIILGIILVIAFLIMGASRVYSALFWSVIGVWIYLVLGVLLLSPQANPNGLFFSQPISKFIVESAAYLPVILGIMAPVGNSLSIPCSKHKIYRFIEPVLIGIIFTLFFSAILIGLKEKTYVFTAETFFISLKKVDFLNLLFGTSDVLIWIKNNIRTIVTATMLFAIYKALFAEIIESMLIAAWSALMKMRKSGDSGNGGHGGGGHEEHHEEAHEDFDDFEEKEEYGHH